MVPPNSPQKPGRKNRRMNQLGLSVVYVISIGRLAFGASFTVDASHRAGKVSPKLYGLMTEEINHSYDGGLYAELIRNRAFLDSANTPAHWSALPNNDAVTTIALDPTNAFNNKLTMSLRLTVTQAT